jgi:hypothetical protein
LHREEELRKLSLIPFGVAAILAIFLLGSLAGGHKIFSTTLTRSALDDMGEIVGPFTLNSVGRVHQISVSTSIADNTALWVGLELLDNEESPINIVEGDFWRESGYDSDGHWSESDTAASSYFRLSKRGEYSLRVFAEVEPGKELENQAAPINVSVYENVNLSRYFLAGLLLSLGFGVSLRYFRSANPFYIVIGVFMIAVWVVQNIGDNDD